ncbi:hypothetical protein [Staphylococcus aureus]|uniref:hypothetical protein n=1 Tax=Staphylococcus aureus TaxID=1280 RepID=UPI0034D419E7
MTNNATKTVDQVVENLNKNYDIKATSDMVYTSTLALIDYLIQNHKRTDLLRRRARTCRPRRLPSIPDGRRPIVGAPRR